MDIWVGKVTHYYDRIAVAVLALSAELNVGDTVHFAGRDTDFSQQVKSMEIEHQKIQSARAGDEVALKVIAPVRKGDKVFKVVNVP